jgi:hypothetical protein
VAAVGVMQLLVAGPETAHRDHRPCQASEPDGTVVATMGWVPAIHGCRPSAPQALRAAHCTGTARNTARNATAATAIAGHARPGAQSGSGVLRRAPSLPPPARANRGTAAGPDGTSDHRTPTRSIQTSTGAWNEMTVRQMSAPVRSVCGRC